MNPWKLIKTYRGKDRHEVDIWMQWRASALTMGWADSFRVVDAYRYSGKWFHLHEGREKELDSNYITHWMPKPRKPLRAL